MSGKRIGAFICHCGGNISDYIDEEKVRRVHMSNVHGFASVPFSAA